MELKKTSNTYKSFKNTNGISVANQAIASVPTYWGKQPSTSGPVYVGAIIVFLFILGMFLVKGRVKWWLFTVTIVSIALSWGHNFAVLTDFMLDHFPGYNKFRTVSMTLIMAEFSMPFLAILTLWEIINGNIEKKEFLKALKYSFFGIAGFTLVLLMVCGSFDMTAPIDEQLRSQGWDVDALHKDRLSLLRSDAFRSLVFISLAAALVYFAWLKKIKFSTLILLASLLLLFDMWPVNKRFLGSRDFLTAKQDKNLFTPTTADLVILRDKDPDFRVLNLTVSVLQDATTSYFHKSLGGYHSIANELSTIYNTFQKRPSPQAVDSMLATLGTLNMLNTRYIIYNTDAPPLVNRHELGNAWFVNKYTLVPDADAEIQAVSSGLKPGQEAVIDARFEDQVKQLTLVQDTSARISLTEYRVNYLKYSTISSKEQLAVFSEVYYDKGWQAYIDGKPAPHFRADYLLRAMRVPQGKHSIEFKFHPNSYFIGEKVSMASSLLLLLLALGIGWREWKKRDKGLGTRD